MNANATQELAARYGARVGGAEEAIADPAVTGVLVATSTDTHLDLSLRALGGQGGILRKTGRP